MLILHTHWKPPRPDLDGGVLFWAENSEQYSPGNPPTWTRGRLPARPQPKDHPFCAPVAQIKSLLKVKGKEGQEVLRLPSTRTGPLPSPRLAYNWELDLETPPFLAPWTVSGIWLSPGAAFQVLLTLPAAGEQELDVRWASEAYFWQHAAALALEALAAHKLVPALVAAGAERGAYHARWLAVLDGPKDGPRLARLEQAMPPICRSALVKDEAEPAPRGLLATFLNTTCDALARQWGSPAAPRLDWHKTGPDQLWLQALFMSDPLVKATPAQMQALAASQRAWMRNLHAAGDAAFRITFHVQPPAGTEKKAKPEWRLNYLLQARDDPSLLVPAETVWQAGSSLLAGLNRRFEQPQEKLLAGLGYASRLFQPIAASLKKKQPTGLSFDSQMAYSFLREVAPVLEGAGFGLLAPPWWNKPGARLGVRLRLRPAQKKSSSTTGKSTLTLENLVDYRWELSLGETTLTEEEFRSLAALKSPLIQIRGQWVQLDPEQVDAAIHFWEQQQFEGQIDLLQAIQLDLGGQTEAGGLPVDEVIAEDWLSDWLERLNRSEKLVELPQPSGLNGELRPYQRFGFSWLEFHRRWGLGACLADDMGLGKTIQTIALLLHEKEASGSLARPTLLICPTSVVTNWEREVSRFAPALTTMVHQGFNRRAGEDFLEAAASVDIVLTSYALARQDASLIQQVNWLGVVLDEAQNIKNPSAKQTQAVNRLPAGFRLALTGTPVENRLSELWSIMNFLNPGYLGPHQKFRREYALPIERYNDEEALGRLKSLVNPFILRRVKTDPTVIQDLPEKLETKVYCHLTEEQATMYEAVVKDVMETIETSEGIERRGLVLSMLMQLKQICNHPVQYLHQGQSGADGELGGRSGKLERLNELLEEALAEDERVLVFTQFAEMGQLLSRYLPSATGAAAQFLHGGTPAKARDAMVRRFQEDEHGPAIFILSLKAGGTGLNLTRASHVFHFDRWWNPAVEDQATDRAFRIGQKRNVQVHKFVTTGTLEEMIDDMIESKKGLANAIMGSGENWLTELSTDELRSMVQLRRR